MDGTVLIADDDKNLRNILAQALTRAGAKVRATATLATLWRWLEEDDGDIVLCDVNLLDGDALDVLPKMKQMRPDLPFVMMSAQNTVVTAMRAGEAGAFDYLAKPFDLREMVRVLQKALGQSAPSVAPDGGEVSAHELPLIGRSESMQALYKQMSRMQSSSLPVLITGGAGSGKSLVAETLHKFGARKSGPMIRFHGNDSRANAIAEHFDDAEGGTLILESVGEFFSNEQRQIQMLMDEERDVRIIATTRADLAELVKNGQFRDDLFYRLNVLTLTLPDLRDRGDDVIELAERFLLEQNQTSRQLSEDAKRVLLKSDWHGNVGELYAVMKRVAVMGNSEMINAEEIEANRSRGLTSGSALSEDNAHLARTVELFTRRFLKLHSDDLPARGLYQTIIEEVERPLLRVALEHNQGNQIKTAQMLDINRNTLRKKITTLDIEVPKGKKLS